LLPFRILFDPHFTVALGPHVFPAQKYRLVKEQLLASRLASEDDLVVPVPATDADILRVHTPQYVNKIKTGGLSASEQRTLEVPWSRGLVEAAWRAAGAAIDGARLARRQGCAIVLSGGFHHAFPDHGEGFCLINDVAIAVLAMRHSGEAPRAAILDLDVHHGNGTAQILGKDPAVFTVSLHQESNYPAVKPPSRLDVGLRDGTGDDEYLRALEGPLAAAVAFQPDLLFYLAGADPFEHDRLGGLKLTLGGLAERDRRVFAAAKEAGIPIVVTLAGGYAERTEDTVRIHVNTVLAAAKTFAGG
jgi:acetoin utilization deacetylase AcuC-like enzyme